MKRAVSTSFLKDRWELARRFLDGGYCLGEACLGCGSCVSPNERAAITERPRTPPVTEATVAAAARIEAEKRRLEPCFLRATLPGEFCGHSPEWASARLMQLFLTQFPELTENLLAVEEALFAAGGNGENFPIPSGETILMLKAWDTGGMLPRLTADDRLGLNLRTIAPDASVFLPGRFSCATWQVHTAAAPREAAQLAGAWLKTQNLAHTLRRTEAGWRLELAPAAVKKKCVFSLDVADDIPGARLDITFSPKARMRELFSLLPPCAATPLGVCAGIRF